MIKDLFKLIVKFPLSFFIFHPLYLAFFPLLTLFTLRLLVFESLSNTSQKLIPSFLEPFINLLLRDLVGHLVVNLAIVLLSSIH